MVRGFTAAQMEALEKVQTTLREEQELLEKDIGVPICIENCGKCCECNSITVRAIEAAQIIAWLKKQPQSFQSKILDICHTWLIQDDPYVAIRMGIGTSALTAAGQDRLNSEINYITYRTACPMLDENKRCLIHPVRPLQCRTFGVTRVVPPEVCPRPIGEGEYGRNRAFRSNETVQTLRNALDILRNVCEDQGYSGSMYIAAAIYLEMKPRLFYELIYHNKIATTRTMLVGGHAILWQDQLDESIDREQEMQMICNPIPDAPEEPDIPEGKELLKLN